MGGKIKREYMILMLVVFFMGAGSALAVWAGVFTNARIQLREATCASMEESVIKAFSEAPVSAMRPARAEIKDIADLSEAPLVRADNGEVVERRCRGNATMADGSRHRVSYKMYDNDGKATYLVGLGQDGDMRVFRRN